MNFLSKEKELVNLLFIIFYNILYKLNIIYKNINYL